MKLNFQEDDEDNDEAFEMVGVKTNHEEERKFIDEKFPRKLQKVQVSEIDFDFFFFS